MATSATSAETVEIRKSDPHDKCVLFDIDGILANDSAKTTFAALTGSNEEYYTPDVLDKLPANKHMVELITKRHTDGWRVIIVTNRSRKLDVITKLWLSRYFDFDPEVIFRPDVVEVKDFFVFKIGMIIGLSNMHKFQEMEIYTDDIVFSDMVMTQLTKSKTRANIHLMSKGKLWQESTS